MKAFRELRDAIGGESDPPDLPPVAWTFLRGVSVGALVGAALAGSALLRRHAGRDRPRRVSGPARD